VPKSQAKVETKQERADREARERLDNPDMNLFDRFMRRLVGIPKERIKSNHPSRWNNSMVGAKPNLAIAALCDRVLETKDNVLSLIRVVDTFNISPMPKNVSLPTELQPALMLTLVLSFKAGDAVGRHEALIRLYGPMGKRLEIQADQPETILAMDFRGGEPEQGANFVIGMGIRTPGYGNYHFDISLDGELVTVVPFKVRASESENPRLMN
jgi:hypothetical protein